MGRRLKRLVAVAICTGVLLAAQPAWADSGVLRDGPSGGLLDIARISHRHGNGDDVVYRVVFYHRFSKARLVDRLTQSFVLEPGTDPAPPDALRLFFARTRVSDGRVVLQVWYFDKELIPRKVGAVPLQKRKKTVTWTIPHSWFADAPFGYHWSVGTEWLKNGEFFEDLAGRLRHVIPA